MEMFFIILIPMLLLLLTASFLVVSQVSSFMQSTFFNTQQDFSNMVIQEYMAKITLAQSQLFQRSKQLETLSSKLAFSNQELSQLNNMKSKFLSMVVHDIRTPLTSIRGFGELLIKKKIGDKETGYLKHIVNSTDQLGRLISDLTDLAMIEAGKLKMEKTIFNFSDMPKDILPGLHMNAQKRNVELIVNDLPSSAIVNGDKFRLTQVLMNLMNNAIKFTPSGKKVELFFKKDGQFINTYVKDSGIGIHPSETNKIFGKFYQAKHQKNKTLTKQGWGLGLSIAQEVITSHEGKIGATSPGLGKGATFWFKVPLKPATTA